MINGKDSLGLLITSQWFDIILIFINPNTLSYSMCLLWIIFREKYTLSDSQLKKNDEVDNLTDITY